MKKKFTTIALALMAAFGIGALAQTPAPTCGKADKGHCEKAMKAPRACNDSLEAVILFEGITLTPEQQTKINAIKAERKQGMEACRAEKKQARDAARKDRMDTRKQCRRDYLAKMKDVLTPDQYVVFLENMVVNRPAGPRQGGDKTMMHRGHKGMKASADKGHGPRGDRGERPAKAARK
ncbi:MAG: hypothetical protein K2F77_08005 [Muribaculaceae bacterium]|nr:hypothetical protein [Muribaculaceae bacterium]